MTNKPMLSVEREHRLKIHRKPFLDLESGAKTCEIRDCSDRDFQVGDSVLLMLVDEDGNPTPNELRRKITHIQTGYGLQDQLCVLSYEPADQHQGEPVAELQVAFFEHGPMATINWFTPSAFEAGAKKLYAEQPAPVAVVMPFAEKVIGKLQRFYECAEDSQGADIGRHWFDLLTQLGLLNRVQRSPALWEITDQGEEVLETARLNGVKP